MWEKALEWLGSFFRAAQPQRADFEALVKHYEGIVETVEKAFKRRMADQDLEIASLAAEVRACRGRENQAMARITWLERQHAELSLLMDEQEWAIKRRSDPDFLKRTLEQVRLLERERREREQRAGGGADGAGGGV